MSNESYYKNYVTNQLGSIHKDDYDLMASYYKKNYRSFFLSKRDRILDLGCGMGHFLYFLKKDGFENYYGIDMSDECISHCLEKGFGTEKTLAVDDLFSYFKKDVGEYDVIVLNDVIEHIEKLDTINALKILKDHLNENGRLVIKVINSSNPITGAGSRYFDFTHTIGYTEESLAQVLRMAGFRKIDIFPQDIWVFNFVVNALGKLAQFFFNSVFRLMSLAYGRKTTKIFTKDMIAVAYK